MRYQVKVLRKVKLSDEKLRAEAKKEVFSLRTCMAKMLQEVKRRGRNSQS